MFTAPLPTRNLSLKFNQGRSSSPSKNNINMDIFTEYRIRIQFKEQYLKSMGLPTTAREKNGTQPSIEYNVNYLYHGDGKQSPGMVQEQGRYLLLAIVSHGATLFCLYINVTRSTNTRA